MFLYRGHGAPLVRNKAGKRAVKPGLGRAEGEAMIAFPHCTRPRPLRRRRNFLFLGIADDGFDGLEDWMFGAGEAPTADVRPAFKRAP